MSDIMFIFPKDWKEKGAKKYLNMVGIDKEKRVYLSGSWTGFDEHTVFICAAYDGVHYAVMNRKKYFHTTWLSENYPQTADKCRIAEETAAKFMAANEEFQRWVSE